MPSHDQSEQVMTAEILRSAGSSHRTWRSHLFRSFQELFPQTTDAFYSKGDHEDDDAALQLAALKRLSESSTRELDQQRLEDIIPSEIPSIGSLRGEIQIATGLDVLEDNERLLRGLRERMDR